MNISTYKKVLSKYATGITVITKKDKIIFLQVLPLILLSQYL
jgi:hypothetical protein